MQAEERRRAILDSLRNTDTPVSATALARRFSVSRQIIVGDIALLRAAGADISATPRGYVILPAATGLIRRVAVQHGPDGMEAELNAIVDQGCTVQLSSRYDVQQFLKRCASADAQPLSNLTEGIHLHTLSCPDSEAFRRVQQNLRELGILLSDQDA